ncbi:hypothetical protein N7510_000174 [Penicillium lagena]|uniref:uncharacterized protein n=1 Tax=Penicillium lagena TaxID=94218 RepID=UPI0025414557|nr:uncharacterized protein N7510_000174 [Penicillium lagena]KAJ5623865.1 hypothetical protein N7510_000174 [Penicillium lagena]
MWLSQGLLLLALYTAPSIAASILPTAASSTFPSCGLTCSTLTGAQTSCESNTDQSTWVSCFCASALLTGLKSSGAVCNTCSSSDQQLLSTWYNDYCNSGGKVDDGSNGGAAAAAPTVTTSSGATATSSAAAAASPSSQATPSWWSTHYRWVIMVIVLIIGFSALAVGGVFLKRRYDAKRPNLYHGGNNNSSMLYDRNSGVLSPAPGSIGPGGSPWSASPAPGQSRGGSRADVPMGAPSPNGRSRLQKMSMSDDVEIREVRR